MPDAPPPARVWARFWPFVRPYRRLVVMGLVAMPAVAGLSTLRPLLVKHAIDVDIVGSDLAGLRLTALGFLATAVVEFLAAAVQSWSLQRAGLESLRDLRHALFDHVLRLPARFLDRTPVGNLLARTTSDVEAVGETLSFGVVTMLTDAFMIVAIVVAMLALDVRLTLFALATAPVLVLLVQGFSRALRRVQLEIRRAQSVQTGYLAEQLAGMSIVQLFARERATQREFDRLGHTYLRAAQLANVWDALLYSLMDGIAALAVAILLWAAAPETVGVHAAVTLGTLYAFVDYLQRVFVPIREFSGKLATLQRAAASLERVLELLDRPAEPPADERAPDPLRGFTGGLRVRDLAFAYGPGEPDVLHGIDFDVAPGEVVAVVGRTGSGKTTIGRVLSRIYGDYRGSIELGAPGGAVELRDVPPAAVRSHVLLLQQDAFLFDADLAFNVSLGRPRLERDRDALEHALGQADPHGALRERGGLDFQVGARGGNLSVGEGQLVAFARVAAHAPTLVVLDEATASVDSGTEARIQAAFERLLDDRTVLVIAHRLSTVRRADRILVLKDGRIVERGTHDELVARGGVYAELHAHGFADPEPDDPEAAVADG